MTSPTVRSIDVDEIGEFMGITRVAMHGSPPSSEVVEARQKAWDPTRCHAAFDGSGAMCGSARTFGAQLTVPGGEVPAAAVTSVGVLPSHRRQGHLRRMMDAELADVAERNEPVAVLVAAEYPIYGRYGYGPSTEATVVRLTDPPSDGWRSPATGSCELLLDAEAFLPLLLDVYDRARVRHPGHITYHAEYWEVTLGIQSWDDGNDQQRRNARKLVWRDDAGQVQGAAIYNTRDKWVDNRPSGEVSTEIMVATSDEAQRELVRFLAEVDWMTTVRLDLRPVDDPTPLFLTDGRLAPLSDRSDHIWTRLVDVPGALAARRYAVEERVVIEVDDPMGFGGGRYLLEGGPDGATCTATTEAADLRVPVATLGAVYLGGQPLGRLAAAGWVDELSPRGVDRAAAMFSTTRAPWCAMTF